MRKHVIKTGLTLLRATRLHRLVQPLTRGLGAILMFHHVRPFAPPMPGFTPNRLLEITPEFFEAVIVKVRALGFDIVMMDEAAARIGAAAAGTGSRPFVVLSFDDGYRDNRDFALPILRRNSAPFTLFVTTGFAGHSARMWWLELEAVVRLAKSIRLRPGQPDVSLADASPATRSRIFNDLYWQLRALPEVEALDRIAALAATSGIDPLHFARSLCMGWDELAELAGEPLCTIGAHTLTHPRLAKHDASMVETEMAQSRSIIAVRLGVTPKHFAYPVGDLTSAGPREFALARKLGFTSAVTTRPGMLFAAHAAHLNALPRLSINGSFQDIDFVEVLLSGAPFALWNRGRRVNAGEA